MKQTVSPHESIIPPRWLITLVALALGAWLVYQLKEIVVLLVVGYCIAYVIDPLLQMLEKWKISRRVGVFVIVGGAVVVVGLLCLTALPTIEREYDKLSSNLPQYIDEARAKANPILSRVRDYLPKALGNGEIPHIPSVSGDAVKGIIATLINALLSGYNIVLILVNVALLPFIVFYVAVDFRRLHVGFLLLFPASRRSSLLRLGKEIDSYIAAFVRGQLLVGGILSSLYFVGLNIIGVELSIVLALLSGFGNLIPYFGFLSGIILSSIMALVTFGDMSHLAQVLILYTVVQILEGTLITPKIVGDKVGLSPLVVILSIVIAGKLFGLLGIFLAIPSAAVLRVLAREAHRWLINRAELNYD